MKQVINNQEKIKNMNQNLQNIKNDIENGDANLQKEINELKKYLDKKIKQINDQMNLLTTNDLLNKEEESSENNNNEDNNNKTSNDSKNKSDLKNFRDIIKKLSILRNDFDDFVLRTDIDEIYNQLKYLDENKVDKRHINNNINSNFSNKSNNSDKSDKNLSKTKRDSYKNNNTSSDKNSQTKITKYIKNNINFDSEKYLLKEDFNSHSEQNETEFTKIWDEIHDLKEKYTSLLELIKTKINISDLNEIKDILLEKINELALACNKKFADKNEIFACIKNLEEQLKKIISLSKCDHENGDWLIAKKPINGYTCAACEQYIGELKDNKNKYIPWNQFPMRDYGDKLYRLGNGFSRMLNMLNIENGNISFNQNNISEISSSCNTARQISPNEKKIIKNMIKSQRYQSASCLIDKKEIKINRDEKDNKLPKLKCDVSSDIIMEGNDKEDKPKITKIFKKSYQKFQSKEE